MPPKRRDRAVLRSNRGQSTLPSPSHDGERRITSPALDNQTEGPPQMDMNNDYSHAGPGFKRRVKREKLEHIAEPTPYSRKPKAKSRTASHIEMPEEHRSTGSVKKRIRHLVLDHDMSFVDACEAMRRQGYSMTGVTISNIRTEMKEILNMLLGVGLIDPDDLARYRRQMKKKQTTARDE